MKKILITRADQNIKDMTDITFGPMKNYAKKIDADFHVLDHKPPFLTEDKKTHYRILKVREILEDYDRALLLDADMLVNKDVPNVFEIVPNDHLGCVFEDKGSRKKDRLNKIRNIQNVWGNVAWNNNYSNAGCFVLSKQHKDIFLPHNGEFWLPWGSADLHMSYMAHKLGFKFQELEYKWNHMTPFSEPWFGANRFKSYIIHYAGVGIFEPRKYKTRLEQIKSDYYKIYG